MILLRRWQRYARYLVIAIGLVLVITLVRQADLSDGADYDEYYEYKSFGRRGAGRLEKLTGHGKSGGDLAWLPGFKRRGWSKALPVVIVEEHYEVLQYWFQAAELDLIPKSRNTLVHFDAHPDIDMPDMTRSLPWFHYPKNKKDVKSLMQTNDRFIVSAVQAGLLDHIIWVVPSWDKDRIYTEQVNIWFKLGTLMRRVPGDHKQNFCSCWVHLSLTKEEKDIIAGRERAWGDNLPSDDHKDWHCQANEFNPLAQEDSGSEINPAQCSVRFSGLLQVVDQSEAKDALASLNQEDRQDGHKHGILLDIDEAFFGYWSDTFDLTHQGLTSDETDILSGLIEDVFCADTTFDERIADMFHAALLNLLVNIKLQSCEIKGEQFVPSKERRKCYTSLEMSNLLIEKIPKMIRFLVEVGEAEHILCIRSKPVADSHVSTLLQNLVLYLQNFSVQQLRHLAWLGICFDVSPTSVYFQPPRPLKLCQGQIKLNHTSTFFFHPTETDLEAAPEDLKNLLSSLKDKPSLVTLSRSVRDGSTPKDVFHSIEDKVLDGLKSIYYSSIHPESIHFDSNLLGGKLGWPRRVLSFVYIASPQQGDLRLSGPPSGQGAGRQ
ncbi:upf0489 protein c5orf22 [Plakobranchus ocellatus]|uniref:Upf0489 protein c5orf22 n=1 Tax=Plakobranchus ocellatus TaxID=259542 RepID=A0AAV3XTJ7_9GAST|nr:upf0489 protein c5orf22 [Plakobranchus ocellatus]